MSHAAVLLGTAAGSSYPVPAWSFSPTYSKPSPWLRQHLPQAVHEKRRPSAYQGVLRGASLTLGRSTKW